MSAGCGLTILRTVGNGRATKEWRWDAHLRQWSKISYQAGAWFTPRERQVASLAELVAVLDRVRRDPRAFVVRGALTPALREAVAADPDHRIRRRKHAKQNVAPSLVEVTRHWLMVDIDNWPLRPMDDLADDPEAAIDHAIDELLPVPFHDATCWWQLSSSAGFVPGLLKAHLFFWLTEPATNAHIKAVLEQHAPGVDRAPFSAAQPHFVADPIIEGGYDPLPRRTGWRKGAAAAVALPALTPRAKAAHPTRNGATGSLGGVREALAALGHGEGGQGFHAPLRGATLAYAREVARGRRARADEVVKDMLRVAIRTAPVRPGGDVEHPYCQDHYLDSLIEGAFALLAGAGVTEIQSVKPHYSPPTGTLAEARAGIERATAAFFERAARWHSLEDDAKANTPPEHAALGDGVGTGKSSISRGALSAFIEKAKAEGRPHRWLWLVPFHKLGNEALDRMQAIEINATTWRGREAAMPGTGDPEDGIKPMPACLNLDAVRDALSIQANVETAVCGSVAEGAPSCPWRKGDHICGFMRQKPAAAEADVVIGAHQLAFGRLPKELRHNLAGVIIDEAFWQSGLIPGREVSLDSFADEVRRYPVLKREERPTTGKLRTAVDERGTKDLVRIATMVLPAFAGTPAGDLPTKAAVMATGLTATECRQAMALEWKRMEHGTIRPGQSPAARRDGVIAARGNAAIPRRAAIWKALAELLEGDQEATGRLQMDARSTAEGTVRTILVHGRHDIAPEIAGLPILHMDATLALSLPAVRHYLPRLEVLTEVQPVAPYMEVVQVTGIGTGKTSLVPGEKASAQENDRRAELVRELADFAALHGRGNGAAITYERIEHEFSRPGLRTAHFGATVGLDGLKGVNALSVIGRALPDPRDLRAMALALTGRPIPEEQPHIETRGALMADGTGTAVNVRVYRDPDLEALRAAVTDAGVVQDAGRGRGVLRIAAAPLTVYLFADVVTPMPVNRIVRWEDIRPGIMERMAARGAVLSHPRDASLLYPDLFVSEKAAEHSFARTSDFPPIPLWEATHRGMGGKSPHQVTYKPSGSWQRRRTAWVTADRLPDFRAELERAHGAPLAEFEVVEPAVQEPQPQSVEAEQPPAEPAPAVAKSLSDPPPPLGRAVLPHGGAARPRPDSAPMSLYRYEPPAVTKARAEGDRPHGSPQGWRPRRCPG